jgi:nitrogenase molybdenum-iron protein alpha chain
MSHFEHREPPRREQRLQACIAAGGPFSSTAKRMRCCSPDGERSFSQGNICLLLPALGIMNSIPNSVVLLHGAVGCGSSCHAGNAAVRTGNVQRWGAFKDGTWLSTALNEQEVIGGGEDKLEQAIREVDGKFNPAVIFVVAGCVPGIIGDDVDGVAERLQPEVNAKLLPVHCEGFKTKIWATAYDAVYHAIGRAYFQESPEKVTLTKPDNPIVNLMNVSSMGWPDEQELKRLLQALGLEVNIYPVFSKPEDWHRMTQTALSISTCPTHDDYVMEYLEENYGIPYVLKHMPIGIRNTSEWLRSLASYFGQSIQDKAEEIVAQEEAELTAALAQFRSAFAGKKVLVSAGEFRALSTAILLAELGFEVVAIRAYHHDEFANSEYEKLMAITAKDFAFNIANCQPFEEANLINKLKPDIFLGHMNGNATAAKRGLATNVIYNTGLQYVGYQGAFQLSRRLYRQLTNPRYNRQLNKWTQLPYRQEWYEQDPFTHIKQAGGEA